MVVELLCLARQDLSRTVIPDVLISVLQPRDTADECPSAIPAPDEGLHQPLDIGVVPFPVTGQGIELIQPEDLPRSWVLPQVCAELLRVIVDVL